MPPVTRSPQSRAVPAWGAPPAPTLGGRDRVLIALFVLGPPLLAALGMGGLAGPLWGAAAFGVVTAAVSIWIRFQDRLALRASGAEVLEASQQPRVHNLAAGLSRDLGLPPPDLRLLPSARVNALVCRPGSVPVLAVSTGVLAVCTRTELEAVVAALLVRVAGDGVERARLAAAFAPVPGPWSRCDHEAADVRTAALTRYPPALAAALLKIDPEPGRYRPFYLAGTRDGATPAGRASELLDL